MRIGIDYRMLSAGVLAVNRGMGRYTQQQLREVLRQNTHDEFVLFLLPGADPTLILPEIRSASNLSLATIRVSQGRAKQNPEQPEPQTVLRFAEEYQEWIYQQHVGVYHATTPLLWNDVVLPRFDVCPLVATFYDVIPLVFPDHYVAGDPVRRDLMLRSLNFYRSANRLLAISESARQDAVRYLGFPANQIDLAYPVADPWFRVLPPEVLAPRIGALRQRLQFSGDFALSLTHLHHSKNCETLLAAYGLLAPSMRRELPLLIAGHFAEGDIARLRSMAAHYDVADQVIITGYLSEEDLVSLYNAAMLLIHPSRYEGFGLPVLEALHCGTPVITTTASSLPEVGGQAAVLVDPEDARALADAIVALRDDPGRRDEMRQQGLEQSRKFSPEALGANTLGSYALCENSVQSGANSLPRARLALWTPLPPQKSGIADYSAELLEQLARRYEVEVFVDDGYLPSDTVLYRFALQHFQAFERRHTQCPFDVILYQLGASSFHIYMYAPLQRWPGLVMVHDLVWSYALYGELAYSGRISEFKDELVALEGPEARTEFERVEKLPPDQSREALTGFLRTHYMLRRVADHSRALIVQSDLERLELEALYPDTQVHTVSMGVDDPWKGLPALNSSLLREQLGLDSDEFLVGVFGIVTRMKRVDVCLRAFQHCLQQFPQARLLIVGEQPDGPYQQELEELVRSLDLSQQVLMLGRVGREEFDRLFLACDVVVTLRFPSVKQISAIIIRAFAAGKPLIVSDNPEWEFVPADICEKVKPDETEVDQLAEHMQRLAADPARRRQMAAKARSYYKAGYTLEAMTGRYQRVIEKVYSLNKVGVDHPTEGQAESLPRTISFNKVCEQEDLEDRELVAIMRDVFRHETDNVTPEFARVAEYRQYWQAAMSLRALRHFGALRPDAVILGAGAGTEAMLFYLTRHVRQVFATDLYLNARAWAQLSPQFMLVEPGKIAPYEFKRDGLVVQHMDGRVLRYPDNTFDGVFSLGSIGHFGSPQFIANAAYEMGRVLKPGGILTLSTEFRLAGPPGGMGWEGLPLFSRQDLLHYIIEASGLELVDDLCSEISDLTLSGPRDLALYLREPEALRATQGLYSRAGEILGSQYPYLVTVHQGYVVDSVHLALRKAERYPIVANDWARPTPATHAAVSQMNAHATSSTSAAVVRPGSPVAPAPTPLENLKARSMGAAALERLQTRLQDWELIRLKGWYNWFLRRLPSRLAASVRAVARVVYLGHAQQAQANLYAGMLDYLSESDERVTEVGTRVAEATPRVAEAESGVARVEADLAEAMPRITNIHERMAVVEAGLAEAMPRITDVDERVAGAEAGLAEADTQMAEMGARLAELPILEAQVLNAKDQLDALQRQAAAQVDVQAEHLAELTARQSSMEALLRQTISQLRLLQQQHELAAGPASYSAQPKLTRGEVIELIAHIEQRVPQLALCQSVDISIQDATAEDALAAGASYFGERLSSKGATYRAPNDAWYHIDFSDAWSRPILFDSAAARLTRGGLFVLVTLPERARPADLSRLSALADRSAILTTGRRVQIFIWCAE